MAARVPGRVWLQVAVRCALIAGCVVLFASRFSFGMSAQKQTCLPYSIYLIDKATSARTPTRGAIFAFRSRGLLPYFPDGSAFLKQMAGLPGDHVKVDGEGLRINDIPMGALNPKILAATHRTAEQLARDETVPPNEYLMIGTTPESYDGRYWGYVDASQITARAYPLW